MTGTRFGDTAPRQAPSLSLPDDREYGLVVCASSGEWDQALRNVILRAPSRRYSTYWAHTSTVEARARQLMDHRGAVDAPIADADTSFSGLVTKIEALGDVMRLRPRSVEIAVAELKRYLPDPLQRIRPHDVLIGEAERVAAIAPAPQSVQPTTDRIVEAMHEIEAASAMLVSLVATAAYFADRPDYDTQLVEVIRRLATRRREFGGLSSGRSSASIRRCSPCTPSGWARLRTAA